jgi:hypothetical protein
MQFLPAAGMSTGDSELNRIAGSTEQERLKKIAVSGQASGIRWISLAFTSELGTRG